MRFLVDECLSAQIVPPLIEAGHDAIHAIDAGLQGQSDEALMNFSRSSGRVLITADTDFGELLSASGDRLPSVILLRRNSKRPSDQAALVLANLSAVEVDLQTGSLVVFTNLSIRVRPLPI